MFGGGYDSEDEPIHESDQFKERHDSCTDLPCCCLWILCLIAFFGVAGYGFNHGNLKRLHHGIDNKGQVCGVDLNVTAKPSLYFCPPLSWDPMVANAMDMNNGVCVATCPATAGLNVPECDLTVSTQDSYATTNKLNFCIPVVDSTLPGTQQISDLFGPTVSGFVPSLMKLADSLSKGWPLYILAFLLAVVIGYAYLCCLKAFAKPMIWLAVLVSFLALFSIGCLMLYQAPSIGSNDVMKDNFGQFATGMTYVIGVISLAGALGIACLMCCCHSQIDYAVLAVQMTTDVMAHIPSLLFAPVIKATVKFIVTIILIFGFVYLLSIAHPVQVAGTQVRHFEYEGFEWALIIYYVFMFGWIMAFLTAIYQFSIAYATADYFFAQPSDYEGNERDIGCCNFIEGMCVGLMWHQGSFAFGSFIIAIFSLIQRIIEYLERTSADNPIARIIACCCYCCVTMCKSCAEFINKNAYIDIAIRGDWFCTACQKAFRVMVENAAGMAILNGATLVFQIAGLLMITALTVFLADAICQLALFKDATSDWFLPNPTAVVVVCGLIAFGMAKIFMDVFDMVSDTLMFCLGLEGWSKMSQKVPGPLREAMSDAEELKRQESAGM